MKPLIQGDITLNLLDMENAEELFVMVDKNREHLSTFFGWTDKTNSVTDSQKFIEKSLKSFGDKEQLTLEIWYQGNFVGLVDFHNINEENRSAEVGYWIDKEYEGKGIVTNSCKLLFKYGFEELDLNRIEIRCNAENNRSSGVAKRLGFIKDGVLRQARALRGGFQDMEVWSMLKSEWNLVL